jgi:hypothetical protein
VDTLKVQAGEMGLYSNILVGEVNNHEDSIVAMAIQAV